MAAPFTIINLDKPRQLRLSMRTAHEYEKTYGVMINKYLITGVGAIEATQLLWIMLKRDEPGITFDQVIDLVDDNAPDLNVVFEAVMDALLKGLGAKPDPNALATASLPNS